MHKSCKNARLTVPMCCVLTGGTTIPETTTADVDGIAGKKIVLYLLFPTIIPHLKHIQR